MCDLPGRILPGTLSKESSDAGSSYFRGSGAGRCSRDLKCSGKSGEDRIFGGVQNCRFKGMVFPGDKLKLETKIIKRKGPVGVGEAVASVNGNVVASAQLTFMVGE